MSENEKKTAARAKKPRAPKSSQPGVLRLRLAKWLGIFGLTDAGRVFLNGEDSDRWLTAVGGGLWFSFRKDKHVLSVTSARSEGHVSFYIKSGLAF